MSNVVAAQVRLLRRKLAECGCANPIESIYGQGYRVLMQSLQRGEPAQRAASL